MFAQNKVNIQALAVIPALFLTYGLYRVLVREHMNAYVWQEGMADVEVLCYPCLLIIRITLNANGNA